ncbi:ABC transporter substrate-binding protein [Leucobacter albus]|uniref:ABC transporter substrate-binding protein n=1 Tax=Leucobacter albus TaxID=272210 RepID=A0ABW3TLK2_9MICO
MKNSKLTKLGLAAVAASAVFGLAACGGVTDPNAGSETTETAEAASLVAPIANMECAEGTEPTGEPIVVGGSMSLTGPLGGTGAVHDAVGNLMVEWINECGGIDGRPIEYTVLDDQSTPAQVTSNYERLLSEGVDLVVGPYAGAAALAGAGPVSAAGYAYPTATNGVPESLIGENHFPSWQIGGGATEGMWSLAAEDLATTLSQADNAPKTAFMATQKFPTTLSFAEAQKPAFEAAGIEVVDSVEYDMGTTDFTSIVTRMLAADADIVWIGAVGMDISNFQLAFDSLGYTPRNLFASLSGPAALASLGDAAEGILVSSLYEDNAPLNDTDIARYFTSAYLEVAKEKNLVPVIETQAAAGFGMWQILLTAVAEVGPDNAKIIEWLGTNEVETLAGPVKFDGYNGYGSDLNRVAQVQDGKRVIVSPEEFAGAKIRLN